MYTIGRLAQRAKVNADSIRFYERQGLLAPANKTNSGYRLYTDEAVRRITFIKHAQRCGFSLADIGELLRMHTMDGTARRDAYQLAVQKQTEMLETMESLQAMTAALARVLSPQSGDAVDPGAVQPEQNPLVTALEVGLSEPRPDAGSTGKGVQDPRAGERLAA